MHFLVLFLFSRFVIYPFFLIGISLGVGLLTTYMYANKSIVNQVFLRVSIDLSGEVVSIFLKLHFTQEIDAFLTETWNRVLI